MASVGPGCCLFVSVGEELEWAACKSEFIFKHRCVHEPSDHMHDCAVLFDLVAATYAGMHTHTHAHSSYLCWYAHTLQSKQSCILF